MPSVSQTYSDARAAFRLHTAQLGYELSAFENENVRGIEGEKLHCDVATKGALDAPYTFVFSSGVHGVEGFCGSSMQIALAQDLSRKVDPSNIRILLCHAINPYGFSHSSRVNEDNVDLNRNFVSSYKDAAANGEDYGLYRDEVFPTVWSGSDLDGIYAAMDRFVANHGKEQFQTWMTSGQYIRSDDPYFGGAKATWSRGVWEHVCEHMISARSQVFHIDFHSGLGPYAECEVIFVGGEASPHFSRAQRWFGRQAVAAAGASNSISADVSGPMARGLLERHQDAMSVAFEFGTVSIEEMLRCLIASNWLRHNPQCAETTRSAIIQNIRQAFCPAEPDWIEQIWRTTQSNVSNALADVARMELL